MRKRGFSRRDSNSRYFRNVSSDIAGNPKIRNIIIFCLLVTALASAGCISADLLDSGPKYPGISYEQQSLQYCKKYRQKCLPD